MPDEIVATEAAVTPEVVGAVAQDVTPADPEHWARSEALGFTPEQIGQIQNKGWDGPSQMFESYDKLESFRGVDEDHLLRIAQTDDAEGMKAMYQRLGMPETTEGYKVEFAEGVQVDGEMHGRFKDFSLENHLSATQHEAIVQFQVQETAAQNEAHQAAIKEQNAADMTELKNKWGSKFEERYDYAWRAAKSMGVSDEQVEAIQGSMGGVFVADLFAKIADLKGEATIADETNTLPASTSDEMVDAKIAANMAKMASDPELMKQYNHGLNHPKVESAQSPINREMTLLYARQRKAIEARG